MAVVGLVVGAGLFMTFPPTHKATISVLLIENPNLDPTAEAQTDMVLAESIPVAGAAARQLGLQQTPASFAATYTAMTMTDQVLTITVSGPTSTEAVRRATVIATQFLAFRARYQEKLQQQTDAQLDQQVSQAKQNLDSINQQLGSFESGSFQSGSSSQSGKLQAQQQAATNALATVQQYATQTKATTQTYTHAMVQGSEVLNAATPVKLSMTKDELLYLVLGLVGGAVVGMTIIIIRAITSDRLLRRDDIAYAFGAPVRLSVGPLRASRWIPERRGRAASRRRDMNRVVAHLRNAIPGSSQGPAGLAVAAVDDVPTAAKAVCALAISCANDGRRVVVADLSPGAHAAKLLEVRDHGVSTVNPEGVSVVVIIPPDSDVAPVGPLGNRSSLEGYSRADEEVIAACASADLVLSLFTPNPAVGAEHVATWATDVAALVTAGRSTAVRIQAAGEMVRIAGARLDSVIVIDTDKGDESLGASNVTCELA